MSAPTNGSDRIGLWLLNQAFASAGGETEDVNLAVVEVLPPAYRIVSSQRERTGRERSGDSVGSRRVSENAEERSGGSGEPARVLVAGPVTRVCCETLPHAHQRRLSSALMALITSFCRPRAQSKR